MEGIENITALKRDQFGQLGHRKKTWKGVQNDVKPYNVVTFYTKIFYLIQELLGTAKGLD